MNDFVPYVSLARYSTNLIGDATSAIHWEKLARVVLLQDYNTRVVLFGTTLLGMSAGIVGSFMLLRKRSLLGDVVGHASLPGVGLAFLILHALHFEQTRAIPVLLFGAAVAGVVGMLATVAIRRWTRIKEDAALAIVLSVLFGFGVVLLSIIQKLDDAGQAGLQTFIYGQAAALRAADVKIIAIGAIVVALLCWLLFKEIALLCFDERYARTQGWPVLTLDILLMSQVVAVSVVGLQSVGLLLIVAMLIVPAASARFWTNRLSRMTLISALLGAISAMIGVLASAMAPDLPAGALIVLVGTVFFVISLLFGAERGLLHRLALQARSRRRIGRADLLRSFYELIEDSLDRRSDEIQAAMFPSVTLDQLVAHRSWTASRVRKLVRTAQAEGLVRTDSDGALRLTRNGAVDARRVARNHRLWELYLINYADIAPTHVDRDADLIEHLFEPALWDELNRLLAVESPELSVPASPHKIES